MKLSEIVEKLEFEVICAPKGLDIDVSSGYASDLLSDVMANSDEGGIWCTLQIHQNIIAVASMRGHSAIVLVNGRKPEAGTIDKAKREEITVLGTKLSAFEVVGKLYDLGIRGKL